MPPVVRIIQYICAASECGATWRILPMFLARHLWRAWRTVERVVQPDEAPIAIPERTAIRWRSRIAAAARVLVVLLATSGAGALEVIAMRVGLEATRADLVEAHAMVTGVARGTRLAAIAALVDRLERGVRLM